MDLMFEILAISPTYKKLIKFRLQHKSITYHNNEEISIPCERRRAHIQPKNERGGRG